VRDLQHYKSKPDEIQHSYAMDNSGMTITIQQASGAATRAGAPATALRHVFTDENGNTLHTYSMDSSGHNWTSSGQTTHTSAGNHIVTTGGDTDIKTGGRIGLGAGVATRESTFMTWMRKLGIAPRGGHSPDIKFASPAGLQMSDLDSLDDTATKRSLGEAGPHKKLRYPGG
jgi:hypothetical protein